MNLPNARYARVEKEKITGYLLSTTSPDGRGKAKFFFRFGFRVDQWQNLADALRIQGTSHKVVEIVETAFGSRYHVDGIIETPDGRNPKIKTVWQVDIGSNSPRLITAHPLGG